MMMKKTSALHKTSLFVSGEKCGSGAASKRITGTHVKGKVTCGGKREIFILIG